MNKRNGVADLLILKRTEPSGPGGWILRDPGSDRLDHQDVRETRDDGLAAWTLLLGFDGHQAKRALNPLQLRRVPCVNADHFWQQRHEPMSGRVIESDRAADDRRRCAAPTMAEDFVAITHLFARQIEELRCGHARFAR